VRQYGFLKDWLAKKGKKLSWAIYLTLSEEESITRITARRTCERCDRVYNIITNPSPTPDTCECGGRLIQRPDDTPEVVKKRLEIYKEVTTPLIEVLKKDGILLTVNGEQPIEVILKEIIAKIA
jgi:adenylate kinase